MKIFYHAGLDSTSNEALRLIADGVHKPPFAVIAERQDTGRGRHGRFWASPAGNVYLSMVFPSEGMEMARLSRSPFMAAVITARFIQDKFGLRVTLKWPNDLLFAGRKLGGILCETSAQGSSAHAIVVGVGLNVANRPELCDENRAISLAEIEQLPAATSAIDLATDLAHTFASVWDFTKIDEIISTYYDIFALENGQLWKDPQEDQRFMAVCGLKQNGNLEVQNLADPTDCEALFSIQKEYYWIYQGPLAESHPLLVADLGNSRFKIGLFARADKIEAPSLCLKGEYTSTDLAELAKVRQHLDEHGIKGRWPVHVASVNREMEQLSGRHFEAYGLVPVTVPKRPVRLRPTGYDITQMGIDRLALMEGALAVSGSQQRPLILISAGTALTIDVIDQARHHLGGVILPGLSMRFEGLGDGGSLLPRLTRDDVGASWPSSDADLTTLTSQLGHGTKSAIARGALLELAGAVGRIRSRLPASGGAPIVMICGGAGEQLAPYLEGAIHQPYLAFSGIGIMVRGG